MLVMMFVFVMSEQGSLGLAFPPKKGVIRQIRQVAAPAAKGFSKIKMANALRVPKVVPGFSLCRIP